MVVAGKSLLLCEIARVMIKPGDRRCTRRPVWSALPALDLSGSGRFHGSAAARLQLRLVKLRSARDLPGKAREPRTVTSRKVQVPDLHAEVRADTPGVADRQRRAARPILASLEKGYGHDPRSGKRVRAH